MTTIASTTPAPLTRPAATARSANWCAITLAIALTLVVRGYQFGRSNHTVYLLDSLRVNDPHLLSNDWYTTHTLQYHFVFTHLTAALDRMGILRPAYLSGYLALVALFQIGWFQTSRVLGGTRRTYLLSILLYFISAGGAGLGVFDFLQDSAFVPSNVANIAMLWAIYFWITRRPGRAGVLFGLAGFFHLNHALVAIALWGALVVWDRVYPTFSAVQEGGGRTRPSGTALNLRGVVFGSIAVLAMCLPNLIPAARASLGGPHKIPLKDFVDLYVHLRHPHHYDPLSWPIALWLSFLWPFPLAILAIRRLPASPVIREACRVVLLICAMMLVALLFAGVWFISEPLVQASLFRFSIYPKLLTCIGAAIYLYDTTRRPLLTWMLLVILVAVTPVIIWRPAILNNEIHTIIALTWTLLCWSMFEFFDQDARTRAALAVIGALACIAPVFGWNRGYTGFPIFTGSDPAPDYRAVCDFAREHTPSDAIFLVPPDEQEFRLIARRAIVINFKGVAQLSSELGEWRDRLCRVLDVPSLAVLPHKFNDVFPDIARRYEALPPEHLRAVAEQYHARFVVSTRTENFTGPSKLLFESGPYHLYDLAP